MGKIFINPDSWEMIHETIFMGKCINTRKYIKWESISLSKEVLNGCFVVAAKIRKIKSLVLYLYFYYVRIGDMYYCKREFFACFGEFDKPRRKTNIIYTLLVLNRRMNKTLEKAITKINTIANR